VAYKNGLKSKTNKMERRMAKCQLEKMYAAYLKGWPAA